MIHEIQKFIITKTAGLYLNLLHGVSPKKSVQLADLLFTSPRSGQLQPTALPKILNTAVLKRLELDQHSVQTYHWPGQGSTVLLVHGWQSHSGRWEPLIDILRNLGHNVVCLDAPGQGLSSGKQLNALTYSQFIHHALAEYQPQIVVSHSLGAFATQYQLAKQAYPYLEKNIVLASPNSFEVLLENFKNLISLSNSAYRDLLRHFEQRIGSGLDQYQAQVFAEEIRIPTLLIHDLYDTRVPYSNAIALQKKYTHLKHLQTEHLGHSLQDERVFKAICQFIAQ